MKRWIAAAGGVAMAACAGPSEPAPEAQPSAAVAAPVPQDVAVRITAAQAGQTVQVAVGQRFSVALVGVPTAGYLWAPSAMPAFLTRAGEAGGNTTQAQSQPGFTGGNHWEVFMFAATEGGEGDLTLLQRRPWETSEPPADTFTVRILAQ